MYLYEHIERLVYSIYVNLCQSMSIYVNLQWLGDAKKKRYPLASGSIFSTGQTPFPLRGTFQARRPRFEKCPRNPMVNQHFSSSKRPDPFVRSEKTTMEAGKKTGMLQRKKHIYDHMYIYIIIYI